MRLIINAICLLIALAWCVKSNWDYEPVIVSIGLLSTLMYQGFRENQGSIRKNGSESGGDKSMSLSAIRDLIAKDELSEALKQIRILLRNSPLLDKAIQQSGRFHHLQKHIDLGTVDYKDATLDRNQIRASLLALLREIEAQSSANPLIEQEVNAATLTLHIQPVSKKNAKKASFLTWWQRNFFAFVSKKTKREAALRTLGVFSDFKIDAFMETLAAYVPVRCEKENGCEKKNGSEAGNFFKVFSKELKQESGTEKKFYLLLGKTGVGKSTAMLYLFTRLATSQRRFQMVFFPLSLGLSLLEEIQDKANTILLLDGFDEMPEALEDANAFFSKVENATKDFRKIVIACRTQFFKSQAEEREKTDTRPPCYYQKYYLCLLDEETVRSWIQREIPWGGKEHEKYQLALKIVEKSNKLFHRPLLLPHIRKMVGHEKKLKFVFGKDKPTSWEVYDLIIRAWEDREHRRNEKEYPDYAQRLHRASLALAKMIYEEERGKNITKTGFSADELRFRTRLAKLSLDPGHLRTDSLLHRDVRDKYRFAHRAFKEFFYAELLYAGIIDETDSFLENYEDAVRFYKEKCEVLYWRGGKKRNIRPLKLSESNISEYEHLPSVALQVFAAIAQLSPERTVYEIFKDLVQRKELLSSAEQFPPLEEVLKTAYTSCAKRVIETGEDGLPADIREDFGVSLDDLTEYYFFFENPDDGKYHFLHRSFAGFFLLDELITAPLEVFKEKTAALPLDELFEKLRFSHLFADEMCYLRLRSRPDKPEVLADVHEKLPTYSEYEAIREEKGEEYTWSDYLKDKARLDIENYQSYCSAISSDKGTIRISAESADVLPDIPFASYIVSLDISHNHWQGELDLRRYTSLERLNLSGNPELQLSREKLPHSLADIVVSDKEKRKEIKQAFPQFTVSPNGNPDFTLEDMPFREPEMVYVEGGTFWMGSRPEDKLEELYPEGYKHLPGREFPAHKVSVDDFSIGKHPLTVAEFARFVAETGYVTTAEREGSALAAVWRKRNVPDLKEEGGVKKVDELTYFLKVDCHWRHDAYGRPLGNEHARHPVLYISWYDAVEYCKWLSEKTGKRYRLPTEAEWEYAAIGGQKSGLRDEEGVVKRKYEDANAADKEELKEVAWHWEKFRDSTWTRKDYRPQPVGKLKPNQLGLYDMSGNVWEWCHDWYGGSEYYEECEGKGVVRNPAGPVEGLIRVIRGGSWDSNAVYCRVAYRNDYSPHYRDFILGFRLVFVP